MTDTIWETLLSEVKSAFETQQDLRAFAPFPSDLKPQAHTPTALPPMALMIAETGLTSDPLPELRDACLAAAPKAHWLEHYRDSGLGDDFMDRFGCFCLIGDHGPFHSEHLRAWFVYMPANLHYPWHHHPAEETYFVIAGSAQFLCAGEPAKELNPGDTAFHASNQPHAMTTEDKPILCLVLWRNGFDTGPQLTPKESLGLCRNFLI